MNWFYKIAAVLSCFGLLSCEQIIFEENQMSDDPKVNFEYLWNEIDANYSYFELKDLNWNEVYDYYSKKIDARMSEQELFDVLASMMDTLRDDHANLITPFDVSRYNLPLRKNPNYRKRTVEEYYVPNMKITGSFSHGYIKDHEIPYIRYESFANQIDEASLDHIIDMYSGDIFMILDLRENGGGSLENVPLLLERFNINPVPYAYSITRNGPNHDDFSNPEPLYILGNNPIKYKYRLFILLDRGSYSATNFLAVCAKSMHNVFLVGDTTGGGGGLPNGGQLPNGWTYRCSVSQVLDLDGNNHAENGVPPDFLAKFDWNDITKDEVIEKVIELTYTL
ncbi:MAG: S41 family peptidase [Salibacteraceae bacterium]